MHFVFNGINSSFASTSNMNDPTQFVERDYGDKMPWEQKQVQSRQTFGSFKGMSTDDKLKLRQQIRDFYSTTKETSAATFFQDLCAKTGKFMEKFPSDMPPENPRIVI